MYIKGIFIIVGMLALGQLCSWAIGGFLPGSVIGMILLFLALMTRLVKPEDVRPVCDFLTKNMALFFVPAFIGIMEQWGLIRDNFLAWLLVIVISTVLVLLITAFTSDGLASLQDRMKKRRGRNGR